MNVRVGKVRRLKASLPGTNLELTGEYNQRLVYQAIRNKGPITRNELIDLTGLAKPTIAGIVKRLLRSELVCETERIYGGRGQPATSLEINPKGCFSIGLSVGPEQIELALIDAAGAALNCARMALQGHAPARINEFFRREFADLGRDVDRSRIIGLGVAMSGPASSLSNSRPTSASSAVDLLALSSIARDLPVYFDSDLAAAAAGESLFGLGAAMQNYYYVLIDADPVGGLVIQQSLYRGAHPDQRKYLFPQGDTRWCEQAAAAEREARLGERPPPPVESAWLETACADLLPQLISINCLFDPEGVLIGGWVPQPWLEALAARCNRLINEQAPHIPSHTPVQPARLAANATLIGAASLPMRARLFPTNEALLKTEHHAY